MSYIKEFYKKLYKIPNTDSFIFLNTYADSGAFERGGQYQKLYEDVHFVENKENYLSKIDKSLEAVETGYIRKGISLSQYDDRCFRTNQEYIDYEHYVVENTYPIEDLFKDYTIRFILFRKEGITELQDLIDKFHMYTYGEHDYNEKMVDNWYYPLTNIEDLLFFLKNYKYKFGEGYEYSIEAHSHPIYKLKHNYEKGNKYIKVNLDKQDLGDILAYFDFTCEDIRDGIGLPLSDYVKVLKKFYGAEVVKYADAKDKGFVSLDVFWNRERHCGGQEYTKLLKNQPYKKDGFEEYCKKVMDYYK